MTKQDEIKVMVHWSPDAMETINKAKGELEKLTLAAKELAKCGVNVDIEISVDEMTERMTVTTCSAFGEFKY